MPLSSMRPTAKSSVSVIITVAVISSVRLAGSRPDSASASRTSPTMSLCWSCLTDRLTAIDSGSSLAPQRLVAGHEALHQHRLAAALAQDPAADRHDEAHLLGERDELVRRDEAALRVAPAQQRLDAGGAAVGEPDDRLVVKLELIGGERALEVGAQLETREDALVHGRLEQAVAALAVALGDVHRRVGVADELLGVGRGLALDDRDAHAGACDELLPVERERA